MKMITIIGLTFLLHYISSAQSWQKIGLENLTIEHVYAKGDTIWAGTIDSTYKMEIYYSYNGGGEWQKVDDTTPLINGWVRLLRVDPDDSRTIYAQTLNGRGLKSTDSGVNWEYLFPEAEPWNDEYKTKELHLSPHNKKVMFSIISWGSWDQLYRTTDGGESWLDVSAFAVTNHGLNLEFAFDPTDSNKIYVTGDNSIYQTFYVSNNRGNYWQAISESPAKRIIFPFIGEETHIMLYRFELFKSVDGGISWDGPIGNLITQIVSNDERKPETLIANGYLSTEIGEYRIFISEDVGQNWEKIDGSEELNLNFSEPQPKESLIFDYEKSTIFTGTKGGGLYKYNLITSLEADKTLLSKEYRLEQNYPNPFNPNTVISYTIGTGQLAVRSNVELKVYDILGKEIQTLVNKTQQPGTYKVEFSGAGLPSGIYVYKLTAGAKSLSRKMLLLK